MEHSARTVVLLHGTARTPRSLFRLERHLQSLGYNTCNLAYPWRLADIPALAQTLAVALSTAGLAETRLDFVTHSMGGLVAAHLLTHRAPDAVGRVVMLAPPLGGSQVADVLASLPPYRWLYGPAGQQLTTTAGTLAGLTPTYPFGVIAGTLGWPYLLGSLVLPRPHDGRVSLASTRALAATDHIALRVSHSFMPANREVHRQVVQFLETGAFDHRAKQRPPRLTPAA